MLGQGEVPPAQPSQEHGDRGRGCDPLTTQHPPAQEAAGRPPRGPTPKLRRQRDSNSSRVFTVRLRQTREDETLRPQQGRALGIQGAPPSSCSPVPAPLRARRTREGKNRDRWTREPRHPNRRAGRAASNRVSLQLNHTCTAEERHRDARPLQSKQHRLTLL